MRKEQKLNKKLQNIILAVSILISFGFHLSGMKSQLGQASIMYSILWAIINYLLYNDCSGFFYKIQ